MQLVQCDMFSRFFDGIYEKYVDSKELCYRHIIGDVTNIQYPLKNDHKFAKKNHIFDLAHCTLGDYYQKQQKQTNEDEAPGKNQ